MSARFLPSFVCAVLLAACGGGGDSGRGGDGTDGGGTAYVGIDTPYRADPADPTVELYGVASCDGKLVEVARSFGLNRREIFRRVVLPASLPSMMVGMRLGLGYSWRALVGAELIAASSGIGYMILDAQQLSRPDLVIIGILTIGVMGTLIDLIFFALTQRLIPWKVGESTDYGRG